MPPVILDEAQNTTSMQMKMFLTRLGENGRMIVTGDPSQVDLPRGVKSGLVEALQILKGVEGVSRGPLQGCRRRAPSDGRAASSEPMRRNTPSRRKARKH